MYSGFVLGSATFASCIFIIPDCCLFNVRPKSLIFSDALYYNIVAILLNCVKFFRYNIQFWKSSYPELFVGNASLGHLPYSLSCIFHVIGHCIDLLHTV